VAIELFLLFRAVRCADRPAHFFSATSLSVGSALQFLKTAPFIGQHVERSLLRLDLVRRATFRLAEDRVQDVTDSRHRETLLRSNFTTLRGTCAPTLRRWAAARMAAALRQVLSWRTYNLA